MFVSDFDIMNESELIFRFPKGTVYRLGNNPIYKNRENYSDKNVLAWYEICEMDFMYLFKQQEELVLIEVKNLNVENIHNKVGEFKDEAIHMIEMIVGIKADLATKYGNLRQNIPEKFYDFKKLKVVFHVEIRDYPIDELRIWLNLRMDEINQDTDIKRLKIIYNIPEVLFIEKNNGFYGTWGITVKDNSSKSKKS